MNFQQMILTLQQFWAEQNCIIVQPYDTEKGAGTMNPMTFLRSHWTRTLECGLCGAFPSSCGRTLWGEP